MLITTLELFEVNIVKDLAEIAAILVEQRKNRGIEQKDMYMRIGMKQQQYQRVETGNDLKLSTFLRLLEGLDLELAIVPKGKTATAASERGSQTKPVNDKSELKDYSDDLGFWFSSEDNV